MDAPRGKPLTLAIELDAAAQLAYYRTAQDLFVLAPRGWECFGYYGSGGDTLIVSPQSPQSVKEFRGPAVQVRRVWGGTSGRFAVADIIARIFPAYKAFVKRVAAEDIVPAKDFHFGPYGHDTLAYKSDRLVEYTTPDQTRGLGTHEWLAKGSLPIRGVVALLGEFPDVLHLAVRLPRAQDALGPVIIHQAESDVPHLTVN